MTAQEPPDAREIVYRARWILPVSAPPIEGGYLAVSDGQIVQLSREPIAGRVVDLGDAVLAPALVNAHTHLEFSHLREPLGAPGMDLPSWIRLVIAERAGRVARDPQGKETEAAVAAGLAESLAGGAAVVGEIATTSPAYRSDAKQPHIVAFWELLGLAPEQTAPLLELAKQHLVAASRADAGWTAGLSPHAPYTVHPDLLAAAARLSRRHRCSVAMHVAESWEELELLRDRAGPLVDLLKDLDAWPAGVVARGSRPIDYLRVLVESHRALVIHGNYLADDEIRLLAAARKRASVVYCPRTHAYFNHSPYPLAAFLQAGVRVALGTDSRASNADLDMVRELRFACRRHSDVDPAELLRAATARGAAGLGLGGKYGELAPGRPARLLTVGNPQADWKTPYDWLWEDRQPNARLILAPQSAPSP